MIKRISLLLALLVIAVISTYPAIAQSTETIYVDPYSTSDTENGSQEHPYSSREEGEAWLQAQDYGGDLYVKRADGTWEGPIEIDPARVGGGGIPFPTTTQYIILAVFAIVLILTGWLLMHRSHQIQGR